MPEGQVSHYDAPRFDRPAAAAHVRELAGAAGLTLVAVARGDRARAWRRGRTVAVPEVRSLRSYLVCLHELGHVLGPHPRLRLDQEVAAWDWALARSRWEPTPAAWALIGRALGSYLARAVRRPGMAVPAADHPIWRLVPIDHAEVVDISAREPDPARAAWSVWQHVQARVRGPGRA